MSVRRTHELEADGSGLRWRGISRRRTPVSFFGESSRGRDAAGIGLLLVHLFVTPFSTSTTATAQLVIDPAAAASLKTPSSGARRPHFADPACTRSVKNQ